MTSLDKERGLERGLVPTIFEPCARVLADALDGLRPLARLLDVACGSGIAGRTIAARFPSVTRVSGFDTEAAAIEVAREQTRGDARFDFRTGDARAFTVEAPYDAVVVQHLLHMVREQIAAVIAAARTALRPGGRLVIGQWTDLEQCPAYAFVYAAAGESEKVTTLVSRGEVEGAIGAAGGLRVVEAEDRTFATPPIAPRDLLRQYFEGSVAWLKKDRAEWKARLEAPDLDDRAAAYGTPTAAGMVFALRMLVVVADRVAGG